MRYKLTLFTTVFSLFWAHLIYAQQVDYSQIIPDIQPDMLSFEERLVQLAWQNNPERNILKQEAEIAGYDTKLTKTAFLDDIAMQFNLNEFHLNDNIEFNNFFLPRYNFSIRLPFGNLFNDPLRTKSAQSKEIIVMENEKQAMRNLRARVLAQYEDYVFTQKIFQTHSEMTDELRTRAQIVEEKFKIGEVSIEEYNTANMVLNQQLLNFYRAERDLAIAKIGLEELIGVKLEQVQGGQR